MASNKNKRRHVLLTSCIMAALIVGGSTFAWFTSRDDVVNKLSATSNYDVVAVEDFTPPSNWVPGQEVDKDVKVTNTGNVDAFVKATITGNLVLTKLTDSAKVSEDNLKKAIELNTVSDDQVKAKQAGGKLVYSPSTTGYNQDNLETTTGVTVANTENATDVNSSTFTPTQTGYYIFARETTQSTSDGTTKSVTYDGYYVVKGTGGAADKFYDIEVKTVGSEIYTVSALIRQKETVTIPNDQFTYSLDGTNDILTAKYDPDYNPTSGGAVPENDGDEIIIDIALTNVGDWTENVTEPATSVDPSDTNGKAAAFYYNKILESGTTTPEFITSVTLNSSVTEDAFFAMDYNLKVTVQSAQVTDDNAKTTAVNAQDWAVKKATVNGDNVIWGQP